LFGGLRALAYESAMKTDLDFLQGFVPASFFAEAIIGLTDKRTRVMIPATAFVPCWNHLEIISWTL
jgi:hypothetical protein